MITYRTQKGAPLTIEEIDANFRELEDRVAHLESHQDTVEGIGRIENHGDYITITGTLGTDFGAFSLPKPNLIPKGPWSPEKAYQKGDLVTHQHGLAMCLMEHTSAVWEQEDAFWQEIFKVPTPSTEWPLYERATLPLRDSLGKVALLMGEGLPTLIFFDGEGWTRLEKGERL